jgi:hypothetical protein
VRRDLFKTRETIPVSLDAGPAAHADDFGLGGAFAHDISQRLEDLRLADKPLRGNLRDYRLQPFMRNLRVERNEHAAGFENAYHADDVDGGVVRQNRDDGALRRRGRDY